MFRLIKIQNGRINQPEPEMYPPASGESFALGSAAFLSGGYLCPGNSTEARVTHIVGKAHASDETGNLIAYPVTPEMIFEAPLDGTPSSVAAGSAVTVAGSCVGVSTDLSGTPAKAEIVSMNGATASGDLVLVRFLMTTIPVESEDD